MQSDTFSSSGLIPTPTTLNCRGRIIRLDRPLVMGILNLTPDSFSDGGQFNRPDAAYRQAEKMLAEGADIIDIGGYSSRPGADDIAPEEELARIQAITAGIIARFPEAIISIDTFRSTVARAMLETGAHLINDISAGTLDSAMLATVADFAAPYLLMHMQGNPQTMQKNPRYTDVVDEVYQFLVARVKAARKAGIHDLVVDPGFGFGKRLEHNYELFRNLNKFKALGLPMLVGLSRKSMIYRLFSTTPEDVLELASALHLQALAAGANILRVHDVRPAARIARLHSYLKHGAF
ncbi:MAG: dihydropteroate synthase [Bacteroidota bacterium]